MASNRQLIGYDGSSGKIAGHNLCPKAFLGSDVGDCTLPLCDGGHYDDVTDLRSLD